MEEEIINKVTNSGIITINLEDYYHPGERIIYDLKQNLFQELILKEKEFREFIKTFDWSIYKYKNVAITCSVDAIIPEWAYMLLISKLQPIANCVIVGNLKELENVLFQQEIKKINLDQFKNAKVVIKGCGKKPIPHFAFAEITKILLPYVFSLMYGEPCSTVPVYKNTK